MVCMIILNSWYPSSLLPSTSSERLILAFAASSSADILHLEMLLQLTRPQAANFPAGAW
jgi:hypothetical protein